VKIQVFRKIFYFQENTTCFSYLRIVLLCLRVQKIRLFMRLRRFVRRLQGMGATFAGTW
jgi:hypothetical protein